MKGIIIIRECATCGAFVPGSRCLRCASSEGLKWYQGRRWYEWAVMTTFVVYAAWLIWRLSQ